MADRAPRRRRDEGRDRAAAPRVGSRHADVRRRRVDVRRGRGRDPQPLVGRDRRHGASRDARRRRTPRSPRRSRARRRCGGSPPTSARRSSSRAADLIEDACDDARAHDQRGGRASRSPRRSARRGAGPTLFRLAASEGARMHGETLPLDAAPGGEDKLGFTLRQPCGVVVAITPFNYPLLLVAHKVAPALAAGNAVVLKPASQTPLTALKLTELLLEAGLPPLALQTITGPGGELGDALCADERVRKISFTGSARGRAADRARSPGSRSSRSSSARTARSPCSRTPTSSRSREATASGGYVNAGPGVHLGAARARRPRGVRRLPRRAAGRRSSRSRSATRSRTAPSSPRSSPSARPSGSRGRSDARSRPARRSSPAAAASAGSSSRPSSPTSPATASSGARSCSARRSRSARSPASTRRSRSRTTRSTGSARASSRATSTTRCASRARSTPGNVHVNWTPLWRADLMPYGGLKGSGIGKEGPRYAIEEMTELKSVVFHGIER